MIGMFRSVVRRHSDAVLMLLGDGPERAACQHLTAELELSDRVRFLGYRHDVARWLAAADVVVAPSKSEGLSRAAIEANLCGLPAVAFAVGGLREALPDAICGELVPPGDERGFVDAIERALERSLVPVADIRVRLARARFGIEDHARALTSCYDELRS
jgi:glycosyltransferase involved in cell wall biosynthesis